MDSSSKKPASVDEYIAGYAPDMQKLLEALRQTIKSAVPQAEEVISYGIPTYQIKGKSFIHFGAAKKHIGLYPKPHPVSETLEKQMAAYAGTKGSLHLPLDKPLPVDLVTEIAQFRAEQISSKKKQ